MQNIQSSADRVDAIEDLIQVFRNAIINKHAESFLALFHDGPVPWLGVYNDATIAAGKMLNADHTKIWPDTHHEFINRIVQHPADIEEKFWNIRVHSQGDIASVHFDYSFHMDERKNNWGEEAWQLVRSEQGWRISAVAYSICCVD